MKAKAVRRKRKYKSKLEEQFAAILVAKKSEGKITDWRYEPFSFKLADGCRYTVDFIVIENDGTLACYEVKGFHRNMRDSITRWKVAAGMHPWFVWRFVTRQNKKWDVSEYGEGTRDIAA